VTVERGGFAFAGDGVSDVVGHDFGLGCGEHTGLGERFAHLKRDPGDVPDGKHRASIS